MTADAVERALDRLRAWGETLEGPSVGLGALLRPRAPGADATARVRRVGQPVADLPLWLAADLPGLPADAIDAAVDAAVCGYLYVGLLDRRIDAEDREDDPAGPASDDLLAHRLFARHVSALGRVTGDRRLWALFDDAWRAHAEGVAHHRRDRRRSAAPHPEAFARSVRRARPMVLPGAALLLAAGAGERLPRLQAVVGHSTRAAQLFDDLVDARDDLRAGFYTAVVRRLGGLDGPTALDIALATGAGEAIVDEARGALDAARHEARAAGFVTLDRGLGREYDRIGAFARRVAHTLGALFGDPEPRPQETRPWAST